MIKSSKPITLQIWRTSSRDGFNQNPFCKEVHDSLFCILTGDTYEVWSIESWFFSLQHILIETTSISNLNLR